jgi:hypothetical protein
MTNATPPEDQEPVPEQQQESAKGTQMPMPSRDQITQALLKVIRPERKS